MTRDVYQEAESRLAQSGQVVFNRVVDALVESELVKRTNMLTELSAKLVEAKKKRERIKPDQAAYGEKGELLSASYSKAKIDEKTALDKQIDRLEKAIDAALADPPDYKPASQLVGGKKDAAPATSDEA